MLLATRFTWVWDAVQLEVKRIFSDWFTGSSCASHPCWTMTGKTVRNSNSKPPFDSILLLWRAGCIKKFISMCHQGLVPTGYTPSGRRVEHPLRGRGSAVNIETAIWIKHETRCYSMLIASNLHQHISAQEASNLLGCWTEELNGTRKHQWSMSTHISVGKKNLLPCWVAWYSSCAFSIFSDSPMLWNVGHGWHGTT